MGRSPESPFPFAPCPTPVEQAQEAVEEDKTIPIPTRRKSSTWKGFNLKRQLTKVDMKLKKPTKEKRGSIFYANSDAIEDEEVSSPESDNITVIDTKGIIEDRDPHIVRSAEDITEKIQLSEDEGDLPFIAGSLGAHIEYSSHRKEEDLPIRPDNLELNREPVRPPRGRKKLPEKRDYRLLSTPNIKFLKLDQQSFKDLRDREDIEVVSPQPSFTGNIMRRFSKSYTQSLFFLFKSFAI